MREMDCSSASPSTMSRDLMHRYDRRAALVRDDDALEVARVLHLAFDANQLFRARHERSCRPARSWFARLDRFHHLIDADAVTLQLLGPQEDLHLAARPRRP